MKIVVNSGNGAAGPTFDAVIDKLNRSNVNLDVIRVNHEPDYNFPNGIPNPQLAQNQTDTINAVVENSAQIGIAFDGDFDRCFFFDEKGNFISGEYIVGLLSEAFLEKSKEATVVHDTRVIWNIKKIVKNSGGIPIQSKTGHTFFKKMMRKHNALYGGELSAHHYFRDFAYCDSGMIPWLLMIELMMRKKKPLSLLVESQIKNFPSSGEVNFYQKDPKLSLEKIINNFKSTAYKRDLVDGVSLTFKNWRFNMRVSNTEPVLRLNIESKGNPELIEEKLNEIKALLKS